MLKITNLSKSYNGQTVFANVNLTLEEGQVYCLTAPSGAGKTTLFRILMGLEEADSGEISGFREKSIAPVFQEDRLVPELSAEKNIRLVNPGVTQSHLREELKRLLPEDSLKKPVSEYSGGMRRRTALMRALLSRGEILLLDEPFTGLDGETREKTIAYVRDMRHGRTMLFTTHHPEEADALGANMLLWQEQERNWKTADGE